MLLWQIAQKLVYTGLAKYTKCAKSLLFQHFYRVFSPFFAELMLHGKCFTYLTKTRANSTTYSRKPGNFNGTISFEIDIMKNSSPINLNLGQT